MSPARDISKRPPSSADPFDYLFGLEKHGIKLGLHNIAALCGALGNPQSAYRSVIVAGTNGKGSVTAMVEAAARAAGLRTARYTSPHLVRLEERFVVNGQPVAGDLAREVAGTLPEIVTRLRRDGTLVSEPTFFEVTTALAFELFRRAGTEVAVLEVGMGGRFDATSIAPSMAGAITTIDLDHQQYLGDTLERIASEKAGIIKPGMRIVAGAIAPGPLDVIEKACRQRGAMLVRAFEGVRFEAAVVDGRTRLSLETPTRSYPGMVLALRGRHQVDNAVVAARLVEQICEMEAAQTPIGPEAVVAGLTGVVWPGRLDLVMTGHGAALFDGAHNAAGARALADHVRETYPAGLPMVFAAMSDKDAAGMLRTLLPHVSRLAVTRARNPRSSPPEVLAGIARSMSDVETDVLGSPLDALVHLQAFGSPVLVAGSIFLVGDLMGDLGLI
jgi:dihydrofolate synthase/folylpolyglutamate synthase